LPKVSKSVKKEYSAPTVPIEREKGKGEGKTQFANIVQLSAMAADDSSPVIGKWR
jgi:hypothetical protein